MQRWREKRKTKERDNSFHGVLLPEPEALCHSEEKKKGVGGGGGWYSNTKISQMPREKQFAQTNVFPHCITLKYIYKQYKRETAIENVLFPPLILGQNVNVVG